MNHMPGIEVEAKYRLNEPIEAWRERLAGIGAAAGNPVRQSDDYFAHPARDFAATGEAFRLRTVGTANCLTYKGPALDRRTKTRREIEIAVASGAEAAAQMRDLLAALGFRSVLRVDKIRLSMHLSWEGIAFEACLDSVEGLGEFLELEAAGEPESWEQVRDSLLRLATHLHLDEGERRSYLELLLEKHSRSDGAFTV